VTPIYILVSFHWVAVWG